LHASNPSPCGPSLARCSLPRRVSIFIITQGGGRLHWEDTPLGTACWISACVGAGSTVVAVTIQAVLIRRRVAADMKSAEDAAAARAAAEAAGAAAAAAADLEPGVQLEGAHDDLIADIIGKGDPLAFGFTGMSPAGSGDLAPGISGSMELSTAAAARLPQGPPAPGAASTSGSSAPQRDGRSASRAPAALAKFRQSQLWSVMTHGAHFDVHEVN
jgi:hypothetical protein